MDKLRIASRSSNLARLQVQEIMSTLPSIPNEIIEMLSLGDKNKEISLSENTIPDFFTRELDRAVLNNSCDIAIHSAKDLPFPLPEGLSLFALTEATDKSDALVSRNKLKLHELPVGARVGTSSTSRKFQILGFNQQVSPVDIRGTIEERIELIKIGKIDALVVATCALKRLGLDSKIAEILPFETHPLQGNLAIIGRTADLGIKELFSESDIRKGYGKVTIVGFGPGNPEYLTLKGYEVLLNADLIMHDDLIDQNYINRFAGEKIYVGKRKGKHSFEQAAINQMLYKAALCGKNVVRLKGGDPSIFARAGEEIYFLQERFIETEIVPGITTASAASAVSGITLTHRHISSSVAFCNGRNISSKALPVAETLVFYMGGTSISEISMHLIQNGWKEDTPIAILSHVSMPEQSVQVKILGEISATSPKIPTPSIIIVGNVINKDFVWQFTRNKPTILVTGTSASDYETFGNVIHTPLIEICGVENEAILCAIDTIHEYEILIFTSKYGVENFFKSLNKCKKDSRAISGCQIVSIGKTTTKKLNEFGIIADIQPADESSEGIIQYFLEHGITGKKILIPRSDLGKDILPIGLSNLGNQVKPITVYNNIFPDSVKKVNLDTIQIIAFSSPSCIENFISLYSHIPENVRFMVKGNETRKKLISYCKEYGIKTQSLSELKN